MGFSFVQALLLHAHGKTSQAIQRMTSLLIKAREQLQASENDLFPFLYQEVLSWAVRYALLLGDHTTAQHWIEDLTRLHVQQVPLIGAPSAAKESGESQLQQRFLVSPTLLEGKNLLMARLHLAQGNAEIALLLLQELVLLLLLFVHPAALRPFPFGIFLPSSAISFLL